MFRAARAWGVAASALAFGCVPEGPPTGNGSGSAAKTTHVAERPTPDDSAFRMVRKGDAAIPPHAGPMITSAFEDHFDRAELGSDWNALSPKWRIEDGRLCARGAHNHGAWLLRRIPVNARIEFDAFAESAEGDIKAELWGDGQSGASGQSYNDATSYLAILGGWKNSRHVLARLDEHGVDRLELDVDPQSDDERERAVTVGQPYRFKVERTDGRTVSWSVNGVVYLELSDDEPLTGVGHDHMGFNDWDAPVCFDNLKITPL